MDLHLSRRRARATVEQQQARIEELEEELGATRAQDLRALLDRILREVDDLPEESAHRDRGGVAMSVSIFAVAFTKMSRRAINGSCGGLQKCP
jgi:phosphoenolpyruvate-protein kinase (PTS system EI component)